MVMDSELKDEIAAMLKDLLKEHLGPQQEYGSSMAGEEVGDDENEEDGDSGNKHVHKLFDKDFHKEQRSFEGKPEDYNNWTFKWKNGFEALNKKFKRIVDQCEMDDDEIDMKALKIKHKDVGELEKWSSEFYEILAKKLEGDALTTLKGVEEKRNGFEVWRLLRKEFNPTSPAMALRSLMDVLLPKQVANEKDLCKAIDVWLLKVSKLKRDHSEGLN